MTESIRGCVTPDKIDTSDHLWGAFDHCETEISARYIIQMMQERGRWETFTKEDIEQFYQQKRGKAGRFNFNRLIEPGVAFSSKEGRYLTGGNWITRKDDGTLEITDEFIKRAYKSSPKKD